MDKALWWAWRRSWATVIQGLADVAGIRCPGCATRGLLCSDCARELREDLSLWPLRRQLVREPLRCEVWSSGPYSGLLSRSVVAVKDEACHELIAVLGERLGHVLADLFGSHWGPASGQVVLVPMPSRPRDLRRRGRDVLAEILAEAVRHQPEIGHPFPALSYQRRTTDSIGLSRAERLRQSRGSLVVHPRHSRVLAGRRVVLIDDVVTTGASLLAMAEAVSVGGAQVLGAVTLASAESVHPNG